MKKLLLLMALIVISFTGFSKTTKNSIKYKKVKTTKKFKLNKRTDCYPIQINTSCGTFLETMCSAGETTATERQEALEVFSDMYDNAVCN